MCIRDSCCAALKEWGLFLSNGEVTLKHQFAGILVVNIKGLFLSNGEVTLKHERGSFAHFGKDRIIPLQWRGHVEATSPARRRIAGSCGLFLSNGEVTLKRRVRNRVPSFLLGLFLSNGEVTLKQYLLPPHRSRATRIISLQLPKQKSILNTFSPDYAQAIAFIQAFVEQSDPFVIRNEV